MACLAVLASLLGCGGSSGGNARCYSDDSSAPRDANLAGVDQRVSSDKPVVGADVPEGVDAAGVNLADAVDSPNLEAGLVSESLMGTATLDRIPVNQFKGLNWGYNRTQPDLGNYSRGILRLPYLAADDSPTTLVQKTNIVLDGFTDAGANTIRIPVNIETVRTHWTNYYHYVVATALARGFKVIVCYWLPGTNKLDDIDSVKNMYHTLAGAYFFDKRSGLYPLFFYELANEPAGYKTDGSDYLPDIKNITAYLEADFPGIKKRILVGGTDYSAYPGPVAYDPELTDCYLAAHFYETWAHDYSTTLKGKKNYPKYFDDALGYQISWYQGKFDRTAEKWFNRIIITEYGQWTNRNYGYTSQTTQRSQLSINPNDSYASDVEGFRIAYIWGVATIVNRLQLGSVMWGGLIEDGYSLFKITSDPGMLARNDFSAKTQINELDVPLRSAFWGPKSTDGTYAMPVAMPLASPSAGEYDRAQSVTLSTATTDAMIYYTTDGRLPTTASAVYAAPLAMASDTTLRAVAIKSGMANSTTFSATYRLVSVLTPVPSLPGGTYNDVQTVTLSSSSGASIYYTLDGSTPTSASSRYSGPISIAASCTLMAVASKGGKDVSAVMTATYALVAAVPTASVATGTYAAPQSVTLASATPAATIRYTLDGNTPTGTSALYTAAINITATTTLKAIASKRGLTDSAVLTATYTITP